MAEIILLPVRHHSPACALHVSKMIESIRPAAILVEGPDNANSLVPVMVHEDTKAPFAIYYSYHDITGRISQEKEHYRCYYPFLDYSPELAALREGKRLGIPTAFIDLPYGDILAASQEGKGLLKREEEKNNYNDDYLLSQNDYLKQLCEKTGLRSFDEFWEKYFELNGLDGEVISSEKWFADLLSYCTLARDNTSREDLEEEGCLARERFMAEKILEHAKEASSEGGAILVVTGGFHTPGLKALLEEGEDSRNVENKSKASRDKVPEKDQGVYLMPYSMEAADALNGYASGMPFPGFYQKIWEGLQETDKPYENAVLDLIVTAGKETRKKEGYLSTYDEICACAMARGLAGLRGKREPGAYELLDAVLSSFIKGEYNMASDTPMRILRRHMTGNAVGELCRQADVPPIIYDFQAQCKSFGLKTVSTIESEVTLTIFSSQKHRQTSMLLNRLVFLNTTYARKIKGPNLQLKKDRNLMREIWKYKWSAQVNSALIDVSVYGATIEEAAVALVKEELKKDMGAKQSAILLTQVFEMGLKEQLPSVYDRVHELMLSDTDFYSLADALKTLLMMDELAGLYNSKMEFSSLIHLGCRKLIALLPSMTRIKDEDLNQCMNALKLLYQITGRDTDEQFVQEREEYYDALNKMSLDGEIHAGLNGCIRGILYGCGKESAQEVEAVCRGYLMGTREQLIHTAQFFKGLFFTARDLVFIGGQFVKMLDEFFARVSEEEFMELLPELRMAFTYFTPREIDKIAAMAAALHGKKGEDLLNRKEILPEWYSYGKEIDTYIREAMNSGKGKPAMEGEQTGTGGQTTEETQTVTGGQTTEKAQTGTGGQTTEETQTVSSMRSTEEMESGDSTGGKGYCNEQEILNRWRLVLGKYAAGQISFSSGGVNSDGLSYMDMENVLDYLYSREYGDEQELRKDRQGGSEGSNLTVPRWLHQVKKLFPKRTVEIMERHALEKYGMTELLTDPDVLRKLEPNKELLKTILELKHMMKGEVLTLAKEIVRKVAEEITKKLEQEIRASFFGQINRNASSPVKSARNLDIRKTIRMNLKNYDKNSGENGQLILKNVYFNSRMKKYNQWRVIICVDESGSMLDSVIHSAVMAGIFAKLPMLDTKLVIFDTNVVDLSGYVEDPVETLMSIQLGGGTNIAGALGYCEELIDFPFRTMIVLVTDLYEGGGYQRLYSTAKGIIESGAKLVVLTALDMEATPYYDRNAAAVLADLGAFVGAMTPEELAEWIGKVIM